jgi:hypothetical protein
MYYEVFIFWSKTSFSLHLRVRERRQRLPKNGNGEKKSSVGRDPTTKEVIIGVNRSHCTREVP